MLPHNKLGVQQLRKLKVYAGPEHPHEAQQTGHAHRQELPAHGPLRSFYQGTGRRKTSVARVRLVAGEGEVVVNGRSLEEHFGNAVSLPDLLMPFRVTNTEGRFNAMIKVEGGGSQGQAGRHPPRHRPGAPGGRSRGCACTLRQAGFLTRDPRMKERKKYGLKRARKAPQYTKR